MGELLSTKNIVLIGANFGVGFLMAMIMMWIYYKWMIAITTKMESLIQSIDALCKANDKHIEQLIEVLNRRNGNAGNR